MIPVSTLNDEYIDRPNLTEQKKPSWVYSSSPLKRGRNNYQRIGQNFTKIFKPKDSAAKCHLQNDINNVIFAQLKTKQLNKT